MRSPGGALAAVCLLLLSAAVSCGRAPASSAQAEPPRVRAELRSWVVAGRARHLYLEIVAPPPHEGLSGRVEFTSLALRHDYDARLDESGAPRVGRMTPGRPLFPAFSSREPDRIEAVYDLTIEQAECITHDRVFASPYVLLGTNSNAALRRAMEGCGLGLPRRVLEGGGVLGEFPGVDQDPGPEIPPERWAGLGLTLELLGR